MKNFADEQNDQAISILRQLSQGRDPESGEAFEPGHVLHRAANIRALVLAYEALSSDSFDSEDEGRPERTGSAWGADEDAKLRDLFQRRINLKEIATLHRRSRGGIVSRLVRLKLVKSRDEARELLNDSGSK